jgi:5'-3' exonuclease
MTQVLIDFSNLAYIAWYPAQSAQEAGEKAIAVHRDSCYMCRDHEAFGGKETCTLYLAIPTYDAKAVLKTNLALKLQSIQEEVGISPSEWTFVKDGHATRKYEIYPEYKVNRDRTKFDPRWLAEGYLRQCLISPSAHWVVNRDFEADDTIASLAVALSEAGQNVVVVSSDKDLWQLLQYPNVKVFSPPSKTWIGKDQIYKAFGLTDPKHIALHKSLWGDSGDNVPNVVPRMQKALIGAIDHSDGTLEDFLSKARGSDLSKRCEELLWGNLDKVRLNNQLVCLSTDVVPEKA